MIIPDPHCGPFDLVALFADEDAKRFVEQVIERGQVRGCLRPLRIYSYRHAVRDSFVHDPRRALAPFLRANQRYLISWDHDGSGFDSPQKSEEHVHRMLAQAGITADEICAIAFIPEVEALLIPAWDRVKKLLAEERGRAVPTDDEILRRAQRDGVSQESWMTALHLHPKELLGALLRLLNLRASAAVFESLGEHLSLRSLKAASVDGTSAQVTRITEQLQRWYPPLP